MLSNILDKISFWSLFLVIVLLPVFFLPFTRIPVETSKGLLLIIGLVVSIVFWSAARFSDGKVIFPRSYILLGGLGIVVAFLASALFSEASKMSFFGLMFDVGTFWYIFCAFLLMLVSSIILKDKHNARKVLFGLVISSSIVFLFQILRISSPEFFSLGILSGKTGNLVGSWNTFGILVSFIGVVSLFITEFFDISKKVKMVFGGVVVFSILLALVVNFGLAWELLGIFALLIFVYKISFSSSRGRSEGNKAPFPVFAFSIVMVSLLFFMSGQFIGGYIPNKLGLSDLEVSPSFGATMTVTKKAFLEDPLVGVGPNRFAEIWSLYKPASINSSVFWNTSFSSGSGLLPTFAATTGAIGIISWLVFIVLLFVIGVKNMFASIKKGENAEITVFLIASIYLFVASFFYSVGSVIFLLAFAFTGVFIGLYSANREKGEVHVSFLDDPRKSFFSILILVVLMFSSAAIAFKYMQRFASVGYFGKALGATEISEAEAAIARAIILHENDLYFRTYSQVYMAKINELAQKESALTEVEKSEFQTNFNEAVNGAILATQYNPFNYVNFQALGSVYQNVASLGVPEGYDRAIESYKKASELNPLNPGLKLIIATTYYTNDKIKEARESALEALNLKPDYIDALITLSQIERKDGNNTLAVSYAERALLIDPSSADLAKYVNTLKGNPNPSTPVEAPINVSSEENKTN